MARMVDTHRLKVKVFCILGIPPLCVRFCSFRGRIWVTEEMLSYVRNHIYHHLLLWTQNWELFDPALRGPLLLYADCPKHILQQRTTGFRA